MGKFKPAKGLDQKVARIAAREVDSIAREAARRAREGAPGVKKWVSQHDGRVRPEHQKADGQEVPENLRYTLDTTPYDAGQGRGERNPAMAARNTPGPKTYLDYDAGTHADQPKFQEAMQIAYGNAAGCRCHTVVDPEGIARKIERDGATVTGTTARARVHVTAPGVIQAELGEAYYLGTVSGTAVHEGTHFMENAARNTARARTARSA